MIELYTAATGNGHRAAIFVAECGLPYTVRKIDLSCDEQNSPEYLAINPAGLIPAIVDTEGPGGSAFTVVQSGAIVLYLAEKVGKYLPADLEKKALVMQWFMQACTDVAGTNAAITLSSTRVPARSVDTIKFFEQLLLRYFGIIDQQLARQEYLASELSIADFALFPHFVRRKSMIVGAELRHLQRWGAALGARPGVIKGMTLSA